MFPTESAIHVLGKALSGDTSVLYFRTRNPWVANGFYISKSGCNFFAQAADVVVRLDFSKKNVDRSFVNIVGPGLFNDVLDAMLADGKVQVNCAPDKLPEVLSKRYKLSFVSELFFAMAKPPFPISATQGYHRWQRELA